jgi:poly-gamma-glutamate synthesis protein (capsule biosynthesis protein)
MNPANAPCLSVAKIDCCVLGNNHIMDWGCIGLADTVDTLKKARIKFAGAGLDASEASRPAIFDLSAKARVLVFSFGSVTSGIPPEWRAGARPGVNLFSDLSPDTAKAIGERVRSLKRSGDLAIASIHWGSNWGFYVPGEQRRFAHALIDEAGINIIHGHSSHHVKGIEVYRGKPIFYGCGDFIDDYEGIEGYEGFRADLGLMYFPTLDTKSGVLTDLQLVPTRIRHFRVNYAATDESRWLLDVLNRESEHLGARFQARDILTLGLTSRSPSRVT